MTQAHDPHAAESIVGPHGAADHHGDAHGHDDHGGHGGAALGPLDLRIWAMAVLGILLGLVVAIAFLQAAG